MGRPRIHQIREKLSARSWVIAGRAHEEILEGIINRAMRLKDPLWKPNKTDASLAMWVAEHYWPLPKAPAVSLDLRTGDGMGQHEQLQLAMFDVAEQAMTGAIGTDQGAALMRMLEVAREAQPAGEAIGQDASEQAREKLVELLMRVRDREVGGTAVASASEGALSVAPSSDADLPDVDDAPDADEADAAAEAKLIEYIDRATARLDGAG